MKLTEQDILDFSNENEVFRFGSKDSLDFDGIVFVKELPPQEVCKAYAYYFKNTLKINLNLCVLSNGIIIDCAKGSPDECNNSLFTTFHLHPYNKDKKCPVDKLVPRNVVLKITRCVRICLSLMSKSQYRANIKQALMSYDFNTRVDTLTNIEWNTISPDILTTELLKSISFQVGQTLCLMDNLEVYDKEGVKKAYPNLSVFIDRKELLLDRNDRVAELQGAVNKLIGLVETRINCDRQGSVNTLNYRDLATQESYTTKIDLKKERIV